MSCFTFVKIKTLHKTFFGDETGSLSFFESDKDIPFEFKRVYYISGVKKGGTRGYHAHKTLKQLLFCPYGEIELLLEDETGKESVVLNKPNVGIIIDHPVWRIIKWKINNSVLIVVASDYYSEDDYIRDYDEFNKYLAKKS